MRALSLAEALKIIEGTFAAAREHNCHALVPGIDMRLLIDVLRAGCVGGKV